MAGRFPEINEWKEEIGDGVCVGRWERERERVIILTLFGMVNMCIDITQNNLYVCMFRGFVHEHEAQQRG